MDKCDICRVYTKRPVTIAREDRKTLEKIEYKICHVCMYADKRTVEQKFSYIQEIFKYLPLDTDQRKINESSNYRNKNVKYKLEYILRL